MAKINFKEFRLYTSCDKATTIPMDVRKRIGDTLYLQGAGIAQAELALRIFKSDGPIELSADDMKTLTQVGRLLLPGAIIDSLEMNIVKEE